MVGRSERPRQTAVRRPFLTKTALERSRWTTVIIPRAYRTCSAARDAKKLAHPTWKMPQDPLTNPYLYSYPGKNTTRILRPVFGRPGRQGRTTMISATGQPINEIAWSKSRESRAAPKHGARTDDLVHVSRSRFHAVRLPMVEVLLVLSLLSSSPRSWRRPCRTLSANARLDPRRARLMG